MRNYFSRARISRTDLLRDKDFLRDAGSFMKGRTGKEYEDDEELYKAFVEHMRIATVNEITAVRDLNYIKKADEAAKDQAGRLYIAFDRLKSATSVWETIKDYGEGLARAPSTYISLTGVGILGKGAAFGVTKGITETAKLMAGASMKKAATKAAIRGGAIEGAIGGIQGAAYSAARKATGREEFRDESLLKGAITGGVIGAIPGVVFGGAAGAKALKQERKWWDDLKTGEKTKATRIKEGNVLVDELLDPKKMDAAAVEARAMKEAFKKNAKFLHITPEEAAARPPRKQALSAKEARIGRELREVTDEYRITMKPEVLKNLEGAMIEILMRLGVTDTMIGDKRITQLIGDALKNRTKNQAAKKAPKAGAADEPLTLGTSDRNIITEIQEKYGLNDQQFGYMFVSELSDAGRTLAFASNVLGRLGGKKGLVSKQNVDAVNQLAKEAKMIEEIGLGDEQLTKVLETYNPNNASKLREWFWNLDKARLGMMTVQTATTMRNAIGGGIRSAMYLVDNMFHGILDASTTLDAATRKRAFVRMGSGFRAFKSLTWNQAEGNALRLIFQEEMPLQFRQLFRQNADVSAAIGLNSGMARWARKFNILNTYSDNAFKRAIFLAELQTQLGGSDKLRVLIRTGKFADLAKPEYKGVLEEAITESNSIVYQRTYKETRFRAKKLVAKDQESKLPAFLRRKIETGDLEVAPSQRHQILGTVLEGLGTPGTTWALPFPKFVMNSLEFMATHAPVLGLVGGVNKKAISKQLTGTALLYGAIQLRAAQGPEARWWEVYNKDTKKHTNALALYGPIAPYMLAADLILRSNTKEEKGKYKWTGAPIVAGTKEYQAKTHEDWARVVKDPLTSNVFKDGMGHDYLKAFLGTTFRTGVGLDFVKGLNDDIRDAMFQETEEGGINYWTPGVQKAIAKFGGNWANTFMVVGGEIRDIYSSIDPQYEKIRDTNAVANGADLFIATSLRSLPISDKGKYLGLVQGPEGVELVATSPTQQGELRRLDRDITQFTGLGATEIRTEVDKELARLAIPRFKMYPRYRQPDLNRRANALYQQYTQEQIVPYLHSDEYTSFPNTADGAREQRRYLQTLFSRMKSRVKTVLFDQTVREYNRIDIASDRFEKIQNEVLFLLKMTFDEQSDDAKNIAVDAFKNRYGRPPQFTGQQGVQDQLTLIEMARNV